MKKGMMALSVFFAMIFVVGVAYSNDKFPPCDFGKDEYLKGKRGLLPYEMVEKSTDTVILAMLGGKHKAEPKAKPYFCKAAPGTAFITRPDADDPTKRIATEVFPCFNPIVNTKWGLAPIVFTKSLRDQISAQVGKEAENDKKRRPRFWKRDKEKKEEKCNLKNFDALGFAIAGTSAGYAIGDKNNEAVRNGAIALTAAMIFLSDDPFNRCNVGTFVATAGVGYIAGDRHHDKEEKKKVIRVTAIDDPGVDPVIPEPEPQPIQPTTQ